MARRRKRKVRMDFMSLESMKVLSSKKKIELILGKVKDGHLVILDGVLEPSEGMMLVKETMQDVGEAFPGIEVSVLPRKTNKYYNTLLKVLESITKRTFIRSGLTLVGPSKIVKKIKKDPDSFHVLAEV